VAIVPINTCHSVRARTDGRVIIVDHEGHDQAERPPPTEVKR
jgi:hypothetical protein